MISPNQQLFELYGDFQWNIGTDKLCCTLRGIPFDHNIQYQFWGVGKSHSEAMSDLFHDLYQTVWGAVNEVESDNGY